MYDPVGVEKGRGGQKKIYKVWQKVDEGGNCCPGITGSVIALNPLKSFESTGERRDDGSESFEGCAVKVEVEHLQLLEIPK